MGIFIDNVSVYCDTDNCDSKVAVSIESNFEVEEGSDDWIDTVADLIPSWDIEMPPRGGFEIRCPECSARYWEKV